MIEEALNKLVRGSGNELAAYLKEACSHYKVDTTKAASHCYHVELDGNGRHRVDDFIEFIATKVVEYTIPRSQFEKAKQHLIDFNSDSELNKLRRTAEALFTDLSNSGEGGEILLYILVQEFLKIPQLFCKMPLKTNAEMHYHGVDGIHAEFDVASDTLALYWGESKLYKNLEAGIKACFGSLKDFLLTPNSSRSPQERDIQLVKYGLDLNDEKLEDAIVQYFDSSHPNFNKLQYRGVCLIGFDYDEYPATPNQIDSLGLNQLVKKQLDAWQIHLKTGITAHTNLETFILHIFLIPFPSVEDFRKKFLQALHITPAPARVRKGKATKTKK